MAASTYNSALARLLAHEGGYSNHPADPGGPTKFGITIGDYRRYVKRDATAAAVRAMKLGEAEAIYRIRYWDALRCDEFAAGLVYALFDYAVNSGVTRAVKAMQRLLDLAPDGQISEAVIAKADAQDTCALIARLCDERLAFLKKLKTWPVFGTGWSRRVADVRAVALAMAVEDNAPATSTATSRRSGTPVAPGRAARGGVAGVIAAAGVGAAQWMHQAGAAPAAVVAIVIAAVALGLGVWLVWRRRQQTAG
jgi:lysozyme family protein